MLNQVELHPWEMTDEVAAVYAGTGGFLDRSRSSGSRTSRSRCSPVCTPSTRT